MPERDVYQLVLQLKDEITSALQQTNSSLKGTRAAAEQTQSGIKAIGSSMRSAMDPMRTFSRAIREAMELGHHNTTSAAVNEALAEYVQSRRESAVAGDSVFWKDWNNSQDADYDHYRGKSQ